MPAANEPSPADRSEPIEPEQLTLHIRDLAEGNTGVDAPVMAYVVKELKAIAKAYLRTRREGQGLQPSELVNEVYLKLFGAKELRISDRVHFFALAAKAMRQVLVDRARQRGRHKRGGDRLHETLSVSMAARDGGMQAVDLLDLNMALDELSALDERQAAVVELRFFGGLGHEEVAELLGTSRATIEREWRSARVWLGTRIQAETDR